MATRANSTPALARRLHRAAGPCRVLTSDEVVALATTTVLSREPIPFTHRPCVPVVDRRTSGELLAEIGREIARQASLPTRGGSHAAA